MRAIRITVGLAVIVTMFAVSSRVEADPEAYVLTTGLGHFPAANSTYGPQFFDVSAEAVLAEDGQFAPNDACETLVGSYAGKIVVADRGACFLSTKTDNVGAAGGLALVIANNVSSSPTSPGGTEPTNSVPTVMISQDDGTVLKQAIASGTVNARVVRLDRDSDGVSDYEDNCPTTANADQGDADGDGDGDVCDGDIDGDGISNGIDPCPGPETDTCPTTERSLTLKYRRKTFQGLLASGNPQCIEAMTVEVFKEVRGPDKSIGEALTEADGEYTIVLHRRAKRGRYYARAVEETISSENCATALSRTRRIRR